ncbi:LETM1-related biofilm-associated protein [Abyssalbus ytuae]|uniref:LETM1-related biofilm-associated protein n=1 Tax=Abyssalbus ytuae TaxID=2926907 RepID=A0A9E7CZT0_9FLAO|nr:LETM1-related biofilm-associated protein [Abyssalbus ytuae]UOB17830.1 LETM1-related biofilm-associated protein [Abyssalbus ytuae]
MNPSAQGWIDKLGSLITQKDVTFKSFDSLYYRLRDIGFIYGMNLETVIYFEEDNAWSEDELAKINLITALYHIYHIENKSDNFKNFVIKLAEFYSKLNNETILSIEKNTSVKLEKLIHERVFIDDNIISKTFNKILTNSLLNVDILVFKKYLSGKVNDPVLHAKRLENIIINLTYHTLNSKEEKTKYDLQLVKLFESSLSYNSKDKRVFDGTYRDELKIGFDSNEYKYFMDLACLAAWDDRSLEYKESVFIYGIGKDLDLDEDNITESLNYVETFFEVHKDDVQILRDSNPVKQLYDNSAKLVNKLIKRNSKRLLKEISESKELLYLLSKSTIKELTAEEKKKIREQLLDIFKAIPSLAIFALPGGAILLPLFVKLIPKLLPSAFDDNRVEEE